jgi:hypothetical protein
MSLRKLGASVMLFAALLIISSCGNNKADKNENKGNPESSSSSDQGTGNQGTMKESLPAPTGKVDDLVSALESDVAGEKVVLSEEEKTASDAANDKEEADDFANTSNEEQF